MICYNSIIHPSRYAFWKAIGLNVGQDIVSLAKHNHTVSIIELERKFWVLLPMDRKREVTRAAVCLCYAGLTAMPVDWFPTVEEALQKCDTYFEAGKPLVLQADTSLA